MVPFSHFITEFDKLNKEIKKIFFDFYSNENPFLSVSETHWRPNVDIYSTYIGVIVKAELAGVKQKDVTILFQNNKITIKGIRHDYSVPEKVNCQQIEIPYGEFERTLNIHHPKDKIIDEEKIKATLKEGLLFIYIPFKDKEKNKEIKILIEGEE